MPVAIRLGVCRTFRCGGFRAALARHRLRARRPHRATELPQTPTEVRQTRTVPLAEDLATALRTWRRRPPTDAGVVAHRRCRWRAGSPPEAQTSPEDHVPLRRTPASRARRSGPAPRLRLLTT